MTEEGGAQGSPLPLARLGSELDACAHARQLVVASDFDGVLAPFDVDPMAVRPQAGTVEALLTLAGLPQTTAAVISGRDLPTLASLTGLPSDGSGSVALFGSHGGQSSLRSPAALTDEQRVCLAAVREQAHELQRDHPLVRIETKDRAVVVHTRGLSAPQEQAALAAAHTMGGPGIHVMTGKHILEFSVGHVGKGAALLGLAHGVGALTSADTILYLGDDVTDEDAFTALRDQSDAQTITIKVGAGESAARFRLDHLGEVPGVLERIVQVRSS